MKLIITLLFSFFSILSFAQKEVPFLTGRINDEAGVLSSKTIQELEQRLKTFEDSTSNQIAVLVIRSLDDEILEEYSLRVAETWKIGQKGRDNGVLLLIAIADRKMRIEVGYGLEGDLTDALSNQIIRNKIAPKFRQEDYGGGIKDGVYAITAAISGSYTLDQTNDDFEGFNNLSAEIPLVARFFMGFVFLLVVGTFTFFAFMTKGCSGWFLFLFLIPFYATFPFIIFGIIPASIFLMLYFFGFLFFKIFFIRTGKGKKWFEASATKWASSSSSSGGWSSSSSSSFSGGGGSFGGGGSSGSW